MNIRLAHRAPTRRRSALHAWRWLLALACLQLVACPALAQERRAELIMRLISNDYTFEAVAGRENDFLLELNNIGDRAITGISLSAEAPGEWSITFSPAQVTYLGAGDVETVQVYIQPPAKVDQRQQDITIVARANELSRTYSLWLTIKTPLRLWLVVGLVLVVMAGFGAIFVWQNRATSAA